MAKKSHNKFTIAGLVIFVVGLALPSGLIAIFGIGMAISNTLLNNDRSKAKKQMTAEENNELISVVLPVVTNNK